jgi:hypothetical protein
VVNWTAIGIASLKTGIIAAVICGVFLWLTKSGGINEVLSGALAIGTATAVITFAISAVIGARKRRV